MNPIDSKLFTDPTHLAQLKSRVKTEGEEVSNDNLREVARQFESLFTHMLMKNMRAASLGEGAFDSDQSRFYQDMFDQQMSTQLAAGGGLGIAELLVEQLGGQRADTFKPNVTRDYFIRPVTAQPAMTLSPPSALASAPATASASSDPRVSVLSETDDSIQGPIDFVRKALPHARRVGKALGIAPQLILAQAALESGWGQKTIRNSDGSDSNNLFGIKAGGSWRGAKAVTSTLEFASGVARRISAPFRSYTSLVESFNDYAQLLLKNDRYSEVVGSGDDSVAFASALQRSGYATDPEYANKIISIVQGETLKNAMHVTRLSQQR